MFEKILSRMIGNSKKKGAFNNHALNRPRSLASVHTFYKGLVFDNVYPSISRIVNEFMVIRPYAIDSNGKTLQDVNVMNKIYHPNQQMSGATFRETIALLSLVFPKVYILVWSYDENGKPVNGKPITEDNIAGFTILEGVTESMVGDTKVYRVGAQEFQEFEVMEIRSGVNPYDLGDGYSPSTAVQKWANIDDYIASYQAGLFENGAVPAGQFVITASSVEQFNNVVDNLQREHRGSGRNNNVMYVHRPVDTVTGKALNSKIEFIPFAQANNSLDLKTLFEQANKKIDSVYGVPASIRGVNENNTYASVRIDEQIFIKYTVRPFATRVWSEFTHQLNRILGGVGFAITFDIEIPASADEEKIMAERKVAELNLISNGLSLGYSLDSIVDAFELSNGYKTLNMSEKAPEIKNDKPEVDDNEEVKDSPEDLNSKSVKEHNHNHCLKLDNKTKSEQTTDKDQLAFEKIFRNMTKEQIEQAIESDFENIDLSDEDRSKFEQKVKVLLYSVIIAKGVVSWGDFISLLQQNGHSTDDLTEFKMSQDLKKFYKQQVKDFTKSFSKDTAKSITQQIALAKEEDWDKEELATSLRKILDTDEWRIQRIARTETHRARGLADVEAGMQIQNDSGVKIYKEWVVVSHNPCKYCRGMNGRRVNVTESYLKKGGIFFEKSKVLINDYADIDTAGAHPNCSCTDKYIVEKSKPDDEDDNENNEE